MKEYVENMKKCEETHNSWDGPQYRTGRRVSRHYEEIMEKYEEV